MKKTKILAQTEILLKQKEQNKQKNAEKCLELRKTPEISMIA